MIQFEVCKGYEDKKVNLPQKSTTGSAGYDFEVVENTSIPGRSCVLVKTGIKAKFPKNTVLLIFNRSSNPLKKGLVLLNGTGVIDSDYYGNEDNDGHIMFAFYNMSDIEVVLSKGDKIGQGLFIQHETAIGEIDSNSIRSGGFGSTGE